MINVLIVDDEYLVRCGLRETIDWQKYGFEIVGEAGSFKQAIDLYCKLKPEIVITDIRMKSKNGLELISKMKEINKNTEIIIISGYDSFEYAHSALKQNVNFYLLKPVNNHELTEALLSCKNNLENKLKLKAAIDTYVTYQHNNFILDILNEENLTDDESRQYCNKYNINLPGNQYMIALLKLDTPDGNNSFPQHKLMADLHDHVVYYLSLDKHYTISATLYDSIIILMIFYKSDSDDSEVDKLLNNIKNSFYNDKNETITIGKSGIFRNLSIVKRAYTQALKAVESSKNYGSNRIIDYILLTETGNEQFEMDEKYIVSFIDALKRVDKVALQEMVNNYFDSIRVSRQDDMQRIKTSILKLVITILNDTIVNANSMLMIFGKVLQPSFEIQNLNTVSQLKTWLLFIINRLLESNEFKLMNCCKPAVRNSILYVMEHYTKQINVKDMASELFISPYHLMREFKKETGYTFNDYLTEYRIKSAIQLIRNGKYKIYEISSLVGYNDTNYFYRVFKKITGHNPTYYSQIAEEE